MGDKEMVEQYRLDFSPDGLREHFEGLVGPMAGWVAEASTEQLWRVSEYLLADDTFNATLHEFVRDAVRLVVTDACPVCGLRGEHKMQCPNGDFGQLRVSVRETDG